MRLEEAIYLAKKYSSRHLIEKFFREKAKDDEVYTPRELSEKLNIPKRIVHAALSDLVEKRKLAVLRLSKLESYYGTQKAIRSLRSVLNED